MKKFLLLVTLIILGLTQSKASHLMGGEITYTYVGGNDYEVTLIIYRDCFGINVSTNQTVTFESASCGADFDFNIPFFQINDISQVCPGQATTCNGGTTPGTEEHVFKGIVTLPPCTDWIMHWNQGTRNAAIDNLVAPSTENIYIQNTLNNVIGTNNNSPQFFNSPTPYLCANNLAIYSHAASDPDGDSLYYSFNQPLGTPGPPGTPIQFTAAYSINQPITTTAGMNFDQTTGEMCFTPDAGQIVVVSVLVEEFRNGVLIGSQIREMQVVVDPACTNSNPTSGVAATCGGAATLALTVAGPSVSQLDPNSVIMCPDDNVCFEVNFSDPDGDNITLTDNIGAAVPNATFTVVGNGTPNPIGTFCWTPTPLDSGLNVFAIIATDDACPIIGTQSFVFDVTVFDEPYAGLDDTICGNQQAQLQASGGAGYVWSVISGDPIVVGTNFSCVNCDDPLASPSITTTYLLTSTLAAACNNTDTVTILVVPDIIPTAFGDTLLCDFLSHPIGVNVNPTGAYTYLWSPSATLDFDNIQNPTASPQQTTTYSVLTTSALGCAKIDSTTITVNPPPSVTLVPGDTTICEGDNLQFDVSLTAIEDDFTGGSDPLAWQTISGASIGAPCLPLDGDALNFDAANRELITNPANVAACTSIDFCIWIANNTAAGGCENADAGEDVELNYSINGGATWINIQTYDSDDWDGGGIFDNTWQCVSIPIPAGAATANTMFQWIQIGGYGGTLDNWALDNIGIMCGGNTNYSYSWSPAAELDDPLIGTPVATPSATTVYTVTLTDLGGCSIDRTQNITVVPSYSIVATQSDTNICLSETIDFNVTESIAGAFNYSWEPAGFMDNPNSQNPTGLFNTPGTHTIIVTVDNGGGCTRIDSMTVNVAAAVIPDINIITPDSLIDCGDSVLVNLDLGGGVPATCGASLTNACSGPTTFMDVGNNSGANTTTSWPAPYGNFYRNAKHQFLFTAAELNAMGFNGGKITEIGWEITQINGTTTYNDYQIKMGCTATNDLNAWENGLTPVFGSPITPQNVTVAVGWNTHTLDVAYEWDGISNLVVEICYDNLATTFTNNSITPWTTTAFTSSRWYRSDGTAACPTTLNTGTGNDRPITRFTHCPTVPDPTAFTYEWTPNTEITTANIQNPYLHPIVPTTYEVKVSDLTGSCFDTDTINIQVQCPTCDQPGITIINPTCNGGTDGKIIIDPVFQLGSEEHTYTYTDSLTTLVLQTSTNIITGMQDSIINIGAGAYTITLVDSSGCSKDTTVWLTQPDSTIITSVSADETICINGSTVISAIASGGSGGPYTYTWTDLVTNTSFIETSTPQNVNLTTTSNCYSVFATDQLGCISNDDSIVCINLYPPIIASTLNPDTTICQGNTVQLDMSAIGGSGVGYQYEWFENGMSIGLGSTLDVTPISSPSNYIGVATDNCTTPSDNITVTVDWPGEVFPAMLKNRADSCFNNTPVVFIDNTTPSALVQSIDWSTSHGNSGTGSTFTSEFNAPGCYDITMEITTIHGCVVDTTYPCFVNPHSYPVANFSMTPPITDLFNTEIDFENLSSGNEPLLYAWNFNDGPSSTSTEENPIYTFPDDSAHNYPISLMITDSNGCVSIATGTVVINSIYMFYLPTSFTPNGDGLNDEFRAYGEGIDLANYSMSIFNRWGELMFQTDNISNGWDGTYKGKIVESGTYVWKIVAKEDAGTIVHDNFGKITVTK
ncbi:gliding motility-associated C-terminal domain-containing protein [Vicingaceae bacterium]|nr:gliding motility-associated C-terminal domain-containing protein [Vicingaceae bacterium]